MQLEKVKKGKKYTVQNLNLDLKLRNQVQIQIDFSRSLSNISYLEHHHKWPAYSNQGNINNLKLESHYFCQDQVI